MGRLRDVRMWSLLFKVMVIALVLGLFVQALPTSAQEPQLQEAPKLAIDPEPPPPGTGFIPPPMDLSYLKGQTMPGVVESEQKPSGESVSQPPASFDWRTQGKVTPVKDQGNCGSCYAFASIANIESRLLVNGAGARDFSENNAKECNWYHTSCIGGSYSVVVNSLSKTGTVDESDDPYIPFYVNCDPTCPYQITALDWRIICGNVVPDTDVLKSYIQTYGPVYTTMYVGPPGTSWGDEFANYDGFYTLYHTGTEDEDPNHAVLIVGWDDSLVHAGGTGGWIVKNSWGTEWGGACGYGSEKGYFTIAYGSANIGMYSSFLYDWQNYDDNGNIWYYDEGGWTTGWGEDGSTTFWGLCRFIPPTDTYVTRVEFWTTDVTTDIDVYIYDDFDGTAPSNLRAQNLDISFPRPGYHSVALDSPLAVTSGDDVIAVVKFTNSSWEYPVAADFRGINETGRTYVAPSLSGPWTDLGAYASGSVAIRLRTSTVAATTAYSIDLYPGWNLVSLPLIPDDASIDVVLAEISDSVNMVRHYYSSGPEDQGWLWYQPGVTESTLTTMEDGKGYWVNMSSSATLTITGSEMPPEGELPPTYAVSQGWNLIGFKSVTDMDHTDYLVNLVTEGTPTGYSVLWGYEPDEGYFSVYPMNEHSGANDIGDMEVGHGYWLWATSTGAIRP